MSVIISSDLVLAAAQGLQVPLTHARIMYDTHTLDALTTVVGSSEIAGFEADSVLTTDTYSRWRGSAVPATLSFDLGSSKAVDYFFIAGHDFADTGVTCKVQYSTNNADWLDATDSRFFTSNRAIAFLFEEIEARYWRLNITAATAPPVVAVVYFGVALPMQRPIYGGHEPITMSRQTEIRSNMSEGGQFLGRSIVRKGLTGSFEWRHLKPGWVRSMFDPFIEAARTRPFGIAWRPAAYPDEVAYAWVNGDITPRNMGVADFMAVGFSCPAYDKE